MKEIKVYTTNHCPCTHVQGPRIGDQGSRRMRWSGFHALKA